MSRRQKRRSKHDHKAPLHVSGADMMGKVLVLEGEDKPLDPDATIDLVTEGKKFAEGRPRFVTRDADPMRAFTRKETLDHVLKNETGIANGRTPMAGTTGAFKTSNREISVPIDAVTRTRLSSIKRAGETDDDAISRLFSHEGAIKARPGTEEFKIATLIADAVRDAGPLHLAPHGTIERGSAEIIADALRIYPKEQRLPAMLKTLEQPVTKSTILNSVMSTFASERLRGAMAEKTGHPMELLDGKSDSYAVGAMASVRHILTKPDSIKKLDAAVVTLLELEKNGFDDDQRRRLIAGREARDPSAVRQVIDERLDAIGGRRHEILSEERSIKLDLEYLGVLNEVAEMVENPTLGKVNDSCFHKVLEAWTDLTILIPVKSLGEPPIISNEMIDRVANKMTKHVTETGIFLLQHDWAAAFSKSKDFDGGEIHLPYRRCAFECLVGGHRVCVYIAEGSADDFKAILNIQAGNRWALGGIYTMIPGSLEIDPTIDSPDMCTPLMELLAAQIRAVCIALEAEVAETEVIRAPHRLNQKRERQGRLPLYDYHVVSLSNRRRYAPRLAQAGDIEDEHRHRRLHFVRGHWRHYTNAKTFIKWHLRGDPDLGFVDKEYRL